MSKFKIGDKVRGTQTIPFLDKEVGIVRVINGNMFGVEFKNPNEHLHTLGGKCEDGHGWWVREDDIELAEPVALTLTEIKNNRLDCLIHTRTQEEANTLCRMVEYDRVQKPNDWWIYNKENTVYRIVCGKISGYSGINFYQTDSHYAKMPMYEFADITDGVVIPKINVEVVIPIEKITETMSTMGCRTFMTDKKELENIKNKENDNMNKDAINFTFTKGERTAIVVDTIEHKDIKNRTILEKKTREVKIPTIKTTAYNINGVASTTCDEEDFHERVGCLVASAKIIANKSEEANLMYQIAMKSWGTDTSTIILETLADRAVAGDFNKRYNKWKKIATEHDKELRTCKVCGKLYESTEEARECEKAHAQRKADKLNKYRERKEAMRIARERLEKERKEELVEECMERIVRENNDDGDASWF